ncbi:hypothetical protein ACJ72_00049 [Emergomyces africanus]|uniref:Zn(2)-C6 fungal-type domain-containing protein n=1 Tax=Emergomyces africanus TaxID=1955775 RepID=A0A1B7P941_9EURO|nr:hypothetical protein ACJ72_00049 [Emergomyces africanus]
MLSLPPPSPSGSSTTSCGSKRGCISIDLLSSVTSKMKPSQSPKLNDRGHYLSLAQDPLPAMSTSNPAPSSSSFFTSFRSVSACNRCRLRKNRCDRNLPRCQSCKKARVHCVGYDPTTKREIPRSYVFFLESRLAYLEKTLVDNGIEFRPPEPYEGEAELDRLAEDESATSLGKSVLEGDAKVVRPPLAKDTKSRQGVIMGRDPKTKVKREREKDDDLVSGSIPKPDPENNSKFDADNQRQADETNRRIDNLVSNIGMVSVQGASDPRYLGSTSGISFARVVFSAVRNSVSTSSTERGHLKPAERQTGVSLGTNNGASSMRDSIFGLQARPTMKQAPFPDQAVAERLVNLYFEHANPQIPILHRGEFMEVFHRLYSTDQGRRSSRDLYLLNVVCAIGAGIIFDTKSDVRVQEDEPNQVHNRSPTSSSQKRQRLFLQHYQPEEYHASAVVDLEAFLGSLQNSDGFGGLEELQAVLLLASFALLRPVAPGLWYIIGVAVRLAVDLGLHYEDGTGIDTISEHEETARKMKPKGVHSDNKSGESRKVRLKIGSRERGRREWVRDLRRRLWWCTYSFDRLVSTCVGRPFGITDQVITTEFPSLLDDRYITKAGFLRPPTNTTSYKHVSQHYFKLRLLQSEIQQVLQHQQATMARKIGKNRSNAFMHTKLPSPFLANFDSFRSWRQDIHRRLSEWKSSAPIPRQIGVQFSVEFLELNYWQALIMLYRQSLVVPTPLAGEFNPTEDVSSPSMTNIEDAKDEDDVYLNVAEAGQKVLRLYRQLHRVRLVNYTYLATHHLFMAGISFLYAIWHSPVVRSRLTLDDVDFTILAATSVLGDLMEKCPPAEACRDAFERMSKATVQMCLSTTGFASDAAMLGATRPAGPGESPSSKPVQSNEEEQQSSLMPSRTQQQQEQSGQRQPARFRAQFDSGLNDLLPEDLTNEAGHPTQPQYHDDDGATCASTPYERIHTLPSNSKPDSPIQPRKPTNSHRHQPQQQHHHQYKHSQQRRQQQEYTYPDQQQQQRQHHHTYNPHSRTSASPLTPHPPHSSDKDYFSNHQFLDLVSPTHTAHTTTASPDTSTAHNRNNNTSNNNKKNNTLYDPPTASSGSDGTGDINMDMFSLPGFGETSSLVGSSGPNAGTGLDLGFGMPMDFEHDWSEGAGYDLFDGFFFGAVGGGAGFGIGNGDLGDIGDFGDLGDLGDIRNDESRNGSGSGRGDANAGANANEKNIGE